MAKKIRPSPVLREWQDGPPIWVGFFPPLENLVPFRDVRNVIRCEAKFRCSGMFSTHHMSVTYSSLIKC